VNKKSLILTGVSCPAGFATDQAPVSVTRLPEVSIAPASLFDNLILFTR